ncbi:MAG: fumarylacetoacetate hydrolase family protein [Comamonas sp.]
MSDPIQQLADVLLQAHTEQLPRDASAWADSLQTPEQAYAVQQLVAQGAQWWSGHTPRYWKAGSPDATTPLTFAPLPTQGIADSPAHVAQQPWFRRGIEVEIALRLGHDIDAQTAHQLTPEHIHDCIDGVAAAVEIVDFRWQQGMEAPALLKLADLQSHGGLVLGPWQPFRAQDWAKQTGQVCIGQQAPFAFTGTHSLGDPFRVVLGWIQHATHHYGTLPAGSVVTTGTWCGLLYAEAGDHVSAVMDGWGEVHVQF